jgi:methylmalonyl-CoA mutase cobalamin-binding subunit
VAREHAATAISETVVAALAARMSPPPAPRGHFVVACAEREWHSLPARIVAHALRRAGWRTTYLGACTPPGHLVRFLDETGADAVAVSCSVAAALPAARRLIEAVRESGRPVLAGGPAFGADPRRALALGATAWAADAAGAVAAAAALTPQSGPCQPLRHDGADEHVEVQLRFADFRGQILARWADPPGELAGDLVDHALHALAASLLVDDRAVLTDADRWLVDLFTARGHDPVLAARLWLAVHDTVGELLPRARADLAGLATGR